MIAIDPLMPQLVTSGTRPRSELSDGTFQAELDAAMRPDKDDPVLMSAASYTNGPSSTKDTSAVGEGAAPTGSKDGADESSHSIETIDPAAAAPTAVVLVVPTTTSIVPVALGPLAALLDPAELGADTSVTASTASPTPLTGTIAVAATATGASLDHGYLQGAVIAPEVSGASQGVVSSGVSPTGAAASAPVIDEPAATNTGVSPAPLSAAPALSDTDASVAVSTPDADMSAARRSQDAIPTTSSLTDGSAVLPPMATTEPVAVTGDDQAASVVAAPGENTEVSTDAATNDVSGADTGESLPGVARDLTTATAAKPDTAPPDPLATARSAAAETARAEAWELAQRIRTLGSIETVVQTSLGELVVSASQNAAGVRVVLAGDAAAQLDLAALQSQLAGIDVAVDDRPHSRARPERSDTVAPHAQQPVAQHTAPARHQSSLRQLDVLA